MIKLHYWDPLPLCLLVTGWCEWCRATDTVLFYTNSSHGEFICKWPVASYRQAREPCPPGESPTLSPYIVYWTLVSRISDFKKLWHQKPITISCFSEDNGQEKYESIEFLEGLIYTHCTLRVLANLNSSKRN